VEETKDVNNSSKEKFWLGGGLQNNTKMDGQIEILSERGGDTGGGRERGGGF